MVGAVVPQPSFSKQELRALVAMAASCLVAGCSGGNCRQTLTVWCPWQSCNMPVLSWQLAAGSDECTAKDAVTTLFLNACRCCCCRKCMDCNMSCQAVAGPSSSPMTSTKVCSGGVGCQQDQLASQVQQLASHQSSLSSQLEATAAANQQLTAQVAQLQGEKQAQVRWQAVEMGRSGRCQGSIRLTSGLTVRPAARDVVTGASWLRLQQLLHTSSLCPITPTVWGCMVCVGASSLTVVHLLPSS
jgi:outer membrane murein-binding lipoprotein Lpp